MKRREFVWMVAGVAVAPEALFGQQTQNPLPPPPAPVPWTLGLNPKTPIPQTVNEDALAETDLHFFTAAQFAVLVRLSALMMPASGDKPGAIDAEAPAFLDFLIGVSPAPRKTLYTTGLAWLDAESQRKSGMLFAKTSNEQADSIVKPWLRTWMTDHPPTEMHADFVNIAHADIRRKNNMVSCSTTARNASKATKDIVFS